MVDSMLDIIPRVLESGSAVRYEFNLRYSGGSHDVTLFYEFAKEFAPTPPEQFDGALCAVVLHAMAEGRDVHLHGPATKTMLRNLEEFQLAWSRWLPAVYRPIVISADSVIETAPIRKTRAISAFSGGVDSSFTLLVETVQQGLSRHNLDTMLLVHGFDVALSNEAALRELLDRSKAVRDLSGAELRVVRTNSKELRLQEWGHSFGAQLAACLHLFSADFSHALVGSSEPYDAMILPWGSNPVTDHLLSGAHLAIVHHGAAFSRTDKVAALAKFPAAVKSLKVCWEGREKGRNCGVCEKCVRTQLNLLAVGIPNPPCFDRPLDLRRVEGLSIQRDVVLAELQSIADYADRREMDAEWLDVLKRRLRRGKRNWTVRSRLRRSLAKAGLLESARRVNRHLRGVFGS